VAEQLPRAPDAEEAVLGALIIDPTNLAAVSERLRPGDFYAEKNRVIFQAMVEMDQAGDTPDLVSLTEHLRKTRSLDKAGSIPYLMGLGDKAPGGSYLAEQFADIVIDKSRLRELVSFSQYVHTRALSGDEASAVYADATLKLGDLGYHDSGGGELHQRYADEAEALLEDEAAGYVPTGFVQLDRLMGGVKGFTVLAGRPSQGKSTLARDMLRNAAARGQKVALFTPDQSGGDIYRLEASRLSDVSLAKVRAREANPRELERWRDALRGVRETFHLTFKVDDRPLTLPSLVSRARAAAQWGAELIAVDYLQLVDVPGLRADGEYHAVTASSKAIKRLARELGIPILVLAQLSRAVESRRDPRPMLSDLRSSGQIEQDADTVMFVYRANPSGNPIEPVDVILAKQKDGPTGMAQLLLHKAKTTFTEGS
jgi:replicative DNA helicase